MAEASNNPAEQPELRAAAPQQRGPLASSGAAPSDSDMPPGPAATASPSPAATASPSPAAAFAAPTDPVAAADALSRPPLTSAAPLSAAPAASLPLPEKGADSTPVAKTGGDDKTDEGTKIGGADAKTDEADAKTSGTDGKPSGVDGKPEADAKAGGTPGKARRRFRPLHTTGRAARGVATWVRGPVGRVVVPGVLVATLVVLAGSFGAYLVPQALETTAAPSATPTFGAGAEGSAPPPVGASPGTQPGLPGTQPGLPGAGTLPSIPVPGGNTGLPGVLPNQPAVNAARPADALAAWAEQTGTRVGIPVVAVQAYGYAELVLTQTNPGCRLEWTTLAAIGKVESSHGSFNGAVLGADGVAQPTILGLPLDGQGGRQLIADTDRGTLDQDTTFDRAIGPMQFIPATWKETAVDADRDGVANPNDIDDAALTAAVYLCKGSRDLSRTDSWWDAILSYNAVRPYAQKVFATAQDYGRRSKA